MHMYKCQSDDAPPHPTTPAHRMFASHDTQVPPYTKDRLLVRSRAPDPRAKSENRFARRSISLRRRHTWWCVLCALHLRARLVAAFRRWRGARRAAFHKLENTLLLVDCSRVLDSRNRLLRPLSRICWRQLCQAVACHMFSTMGSSPWSSALSMRRECEATKIWRGRRFLAGRLAMDASGSSCRECFVALPSYGS